MVTARQPPRSVKRFYVQCANKFILDSTKFCALQASSTTGTNTIYMNCIPAGTSYNKASGRKVAIHRLYARIGCHFPQMTLTTVGASEENTPNPNVWLYLCLNTNVAGSAGTQDDNQDVYSHPLTQQGWADDPPSVVGTLCDWPASTRNLASSDQFRVLKSIVLTANNQPVYNGTGNSYVFPTYDMFAEVSLTFKKPLITTYKPDRTISGTTAPASYLRDNGLFWLVVQNTHSAAAGESSRVGVDGLQILNTLDFTEIQ